MARAYVVMTYDDPPKFLVLQGEHQNCIASFSTLAAANAFAEGENSPLHTLFVFEGQIHRKAECARGACVCGAQAPEVEVLAMPGETIVAEDACAIVAEQRYRARQSADDWAAMRDLARLLPEAECAKLAAISAVNRHSCVECFTCACQAVLDERAAYEASARRIWRERGQG
jgi:hypothetical protein